MKIARHSAFKSQTDGDTWYNNWSNQVLTLYKRQLSPIQITTSLGRTHIWKFKHVSPKTALVIFPGFRTSSLFWDLDGGLDYILEDFDVYLVETNGQPNPSDGNTPSIRSLDYGIWAQEVLDGLQLERVFIAGASFGGLVCMKLALAAPHRVQAAFLLNPGCLQPFSLKFRNLYLNMLPIISPKRSHILKFLQGAVFHHPTHVLSPEALELCLDFEEYVLKHYKDKTQKPYFMKTELNDIQVPVYLLLGDQDLLFPTYKSEKNARKHISTLIQIKIFKGVGHGIETYRPALEYLAETMKKLSL